MINTSKFARKPFYVDAVQVTPENMEEVAKWCGGKILLDEETGAPFIKARVQRPINQRQTEAYATDWMLKAGAGFKIYTEKAFAKSFDQVKTLTKAQADEAGVHPPIEPSSKPIKTISKAELIEVRLDTNSLSYVEDPSDFLRRIADSK